MCVYVCVSVKYIEGDPCLCGYIMYIHTFCLRQIRQASPRARLRVPVTEAVEEWEAPLDL